MRVSADAAVGRSAFARLADDERWLWRLMLAPAVLYILLLVGFPFLLSLYYSLSDATVASRELNFVGLSNFKVDEIEECMKTRRVDVVQYGYNMFDRRMEQAILPFCEQNGIGYMAYGSLAYGLLTGSFKEDHDFGSADWRARQGKMGAIKMFEALFGAESFPNNVRAVDELKPIAARYQRRLLTYGAELITERLPGARPLSEVLAEGGMDDARWAAIGRCLRHFHDAGVQHADLNAHNIMLGERREVWLLDFDRGRLRHPGAWQRRVLDRLARSLAKISAGATDWQAGFALLRLAHDA